MPYLKLDCRACSEGQKLWYGCERESTISDSFFEIGPYKLNRCPLKIIDANTREHLRAYRRYDSKGHFPDAGGWMDQAARFNDVVDIAERELAKINDKSRTRDSFKSKR